MIVWVLAIIAILSVVLSLLSLHRELKKTKHEEQITHELGKGKVLFYSPSEDVSDSSKS